MEHTPDSPCPCLEGRELFLTVREDARRCARDLAVISDKGPAPPDSYLDSLGRLAGEVVRVSHVFRGPAGAPAEYSVRAINSEASKALRLRPMLAVEHEPFVRSDWPAWSGRCCCYRGHNSSSGRCNVNGGVTDPTRFAWAEGPTTPASAYCVYCRKECGHGDGTRLTDLKGGRA